MHVIECPHRYFRKKALSKKRISFDWSHACNYISHNVASRSQRMNEKPAPLGRDGGQETRIAQCSQGAAAGKPVLL